MKTLECWPALPIVVEYGGFPALDPPAPEDEVNITAALKHCDRISSISLTVTRSLLERFYTLRGNFFDLESLVLLFQDDVWPTPPSTFRWGARLRSLHLTGVAAFVIPQFLSCSKSLVDIQLHEISEIGSFTPAALLHALSGSTQLRSLSLRFLPSTTYFVVSEPLEHRVILPILTSLKYQGPIQCSNTFLAILDAPSLVDVEITLFDGPISDFTNLPESWVGLGTQMSHRRSDILFSERSVSISLTQAASTCFKLQVLCEPFSWKLSFIARFCTHFSAFLSSVDDLRISTTQTPTGQDDGDREDWLKLIHAFRGTKWLHLAGESDFITGIALVLRSPETVFPRPVFSGIVFPETVFPEILFPGPVFPETAFPRPVFSETMFPGPVFPETVLPGPVFPETVFPGPVFSETVFPRPVFSGPVLPALQKLCIRESESHYAPSREAVESFMHSRRLSGQLIWAKYERPLINQLDEIGPISPQVTSEMLNDDVLLYIFRHSLDGSLRFWPTLTHICRRWRQIVLGSPLGLNLQLYCTYGMPVLKSLDCWPPFPLVVDYGGSPLLSPPGPEDEDDLMAALKLTDRVRSISLTITSSLLERLSTISEPFSNLDELVLLSRDDQQLTPPGAFRWDSRLRTLSLTRVAIPTLPQLLSLLKGLVDLRLHEIPHVGYFPPDVFANVLSEMTHLETLSIHFLSLPPRPNYAELPP
ncbi:hypothetical protein EI94DRAFT_1805396 [Lactarius quietus]|nr:hypothetical protein EI94DRAFT_1805396 [Lactarius quietus]